MKNYKLVVNKMAIRANRIQKAQLEIAEIDKSMPSWDKDTFQELPAFCMNEEPKKPEIHIFQGIEEMAKSVNAEVKDAEATENFYARWYFVYKDVTFFQLKPRV